MIRADVVPIDPPACSQPFISSFTPAQGGTSMPVTVHLSGQCLDQVTSVCLTGVDPSGVCAQEVSPEDDGRSLSATFDLSSAAPGDWSLQVSTSAAQTAVAPEPFTVRSGGETNLWVEITGREQFRLGRTQTYHVSYGNEGLVDAYDVLLHVKVPGSADISVDLPHPPDDSIDWGQISSVVDMGTEKVIPVWLLRMGAGSRDGFDFSVTIKDGQIGDQMTITAELREVNSTFALTGDLDDIEDSPVFISLVEFDPFYAGYLFWPGHKRVPIAFKSRCRVRLFWGGCQRAWRMTFAPSGIIWVPRLRLWVLAWVLLLDCYAGVLCLA